ncbi:hypothetical protein P152DRAFT_235156 [Eremomyces bilateralis CBS 781.70]|uniref:Thioesterase domain-containing protein n=1 Tax=Eremomyces bilateralis CBS 781.70 TaxID=1392243 RepID=A0A6G1G9U1_9PEZI|nr:uncharacterized protein P152DRAFT_235156 [Eremomyces bilateralis CBS 781.70]KAF1814845.1 hypothetical protein P152DRAFT_235156 [Eremomyces bilateralis CBS 781.70]
MGSAFRTLSPTALSHFDTIPWCAALISSPNYHPTSLPSPPEPGRDSFFTTTLRGPETIRAVYPLHTRPDPSLAVPIRETRILLAVGNQLNGHTHTAHGGFSAAVLDEAMGAWMTINREWNERRGRESVPKIGMTLTMTTTYLRPVLTPGVVLVTVRCEKVEGRKWWLSSTLEDGSGAVLVKAEGLFINPRALI